MPLSSRRRLSVYRVLSAEAYTKEGLNPSPLVIFDEVHAQPSWDLWNTLSLAGGARADSLLFGITTAGVKTQCQWSGFTLLFALSIWATNRQR
jgi:phage terminase large subunit-like protein